MIINKLCTLYFTDSGRCSGLLVSALDSGSRGPGLSPGRVIVLCSWARHFTLTVPLSTQGNLTKCWGVTYDGVASHPGGVAIFLVTSCYRNQDKLWQSWATRFVRLNLYFTDVTDIELYKYSNKHASPFESSMNHIKIILFY